MNEWARLPRTFDRVVGGKVYPGPDFFPCRFFRGRVPERIGRRQSERKQCRAAKVQASGRDISFAERRLMSADADSQPAFGVPGVGCFEGPPNDRRESGARLSGL